MPIQLEAAEIPRRKTAYGEGRPLIIPPGAQHIPGQKRCETCGRKVKADRMYPRKGTCKCLAYQRTTTFIDVMQDEFLLKAWGKRNVAWGMAQRPDLILQATSCRPDSHEDQTLEDKRELNQIAEQAGSHAGDKFKATIGTSLHKLTHQMDRGDTLGHVPERWVNDLRVYDETMKRLGVEWVSIEDFRVLDEWVKHVDQCDHKPPRYGGTCTCRGVAGTVDRIGWYRGRLRIFDIKTGSDFNKLGHAMQLACYAHMKPYVFPGDSRHDDPDEIDLSTAHIIYLPEGKGECRIETMDIVKGWRACGIAKQVWDARDWDVVIEPSPPDEFIDIASRTTTLVGLRQLWKVAKTDGYLTDDVKLAINNRVKFLQAQGVTE